MAGVLFYGIYKDRGMKFGFKLNPEGYIEIGSP